MRKLLNIHTRDAPHCHTTLQLLPLTVAEKTFSILRSIDLVGHLANKFSSKSQNKVWGVPSTR